MKTATVMLHGLKGADYAVYLEDQSSPQDFLSRVGWLRPAPKIVRSAAGVPTGNHGWNVDADARRKPCKRLIRDLVWNVEENVKFTFH